MMTRFAVIETGKNWPKNSDSITYVTEANAECAAKEYIKISEHKSGNISLMVIPEDMIYFGEFKISSREIVDIEVL